MEKVEIIVTIIKSSEEIERLDVTGMDGKEIQLQKMAIEEKFNTAFHTVDLVYSEMDVALDKTHLLLPCYFKSATRLKGGSYNLTFTVDPPTDENVLTINRICEREAILLLKTLGGVEQEDVKMLNEVKDPYNKKKSPSTRLRNILFRMWEFDNKGFLDSEDHYNHIMDGVNTFYLSKLDDLKP